MSLLKIFNYKLVLLQCLFLIGCQGGKEYNQQVITNPRSNSPNSLPDLNSNGGSHTGGGNGVNSALLEDFKKNISETAEYRNQILPIIQKLKKIAPNLAADMIHIASERKWYFVPVELNTLPASQVGIAFKTDQLAVHKRKEIWISTIHYDDVSESKKAQLLLHEIVMGIRLLNFQDKLDQCLARTIVINLDNTPQTQQRMNEERKVCFSTNSNPLDRGQEMRLGDTEHADIRDLTDTLFNKYESISNEELLGWIKAKGFRSWN